MVSTRRKRRSSDEDDDETQLLDPQEAEAALQAAESTRLAKAKRKKVEAFQRNHPPFEIIASEVVNLILSFLADPMQVYSLSKCSKFIRDAITPEVVIRSSVFAGGKSRAVIGDVMTLVQMGVIHVPSTFRLLRIVQAKRCERGELCHHYNLVTRKAESISKTKIRPLGIALCQDCTFGLTTKCFHSRDDTLCANGKAFYNLPNQDIVEAATGEQVGPWLLAHKAKQVLCSYTSDEDKKDAFVKMEEEFLQSVQNDYRESIIAIHTKAEEEYEGFQTAKKELERQKREQKTESRAAKKKASVQAVLEKLHEALEGYENPSKQLMLEGTFDDNGIFTLLMGPSVAILGDLLAAPSSASAKKIAAACDRAKLVYTQLSANNFLSPREQLIPRCPSRNLRAVVGLRRYIQKNMSEDYLRNSWPWDRHFYEPFVDCLVEKGNMSQAVFFGIDYAYKRKEAFVDYVVKDETPLAFQGKCRKLANAIFKADACRDYDEYCQHFDTSFRDYKLLKNNFTDYLQNPATSEFLAGDNLNRAFTREKAVDTAVYRENMINLLRTRRFDDLLNHHRRCFRLGYAYA
ncbi:expressed unknown protein [Seminavis robusta]|uniref:Uncharacterized protein n=1 Tax=Seminavis robusta TaxID=568900 RepID=A0A9N8H0H5_9STRA|nr:expressed unknown protein [Seminavis robusta]|eukprot:Sro20_g014460.1 n/a (575) ;mRNA; r:175356-177080